MTKTLLAFFDDFNVAKDTMDDLVRNGFQRKDISLVANNVAGQIKEMNLISGMDSMLIAGVGSSAVVGPMGVMIEGGFVSALNRIGLPDDEAHMYAEGVRRGGVLLAIEVADDADQKSVQIINQHHPKDIESRSTIWRDEEGWERFDSRRKPLDSSLLWPRKEYRQQAEKEAPGEARLYPREKYRKGEVDEEKKLYPRDEYRSEEELAEADTEKHIWPRS
jgi:hypothetical protein